MSEKSLYLTKIQLREELKRCLNCKTQPCMTACPVSCNPREFIQYSKAEEWDEAVAAITRVNPMGQTCGLICPDKFCMKACTRSGIDFPVNIPRVQATILHNFRVDHPGKVSLPHNGHTVAIVGAGPAGLAATALLVKNGFKVTIYEGRHEIGGALCMIPENRLPHEVIERDYEFISNNDLVTLKLNAKVSHTVELLNRFDAVIVSTGEPNCLELKIPGEELSVSYTDFLYHPEDFQTNGHVAVIGGGNVAADCAATAMRNGAASVEMFVRRRISDMRISKAEYLDLVNHKIDLCGMTSPEKIEKIGNKLCLTVRRNFFDGEKWIPLENSSVSLPYFDLIIRAVGSRSDTKSDDNAKLVYAGDCKTGGSTIVEAISSGRKAAQEIIRLFEE